MKNIKVFCPGSVANISCGFDILGLCLDNIGDEIIVTEKKRTRNRTGVNWKL